MLTINRNSEWKNSYSVLTADVVKSPNDASLNYNLGNEYMSTIFNSETIPMRKKQALEDGLGYMRQSLALYADNVVCHTDMQFAFVQLQQYDSAEAHGLAALRVESNNAVALKNLGIAYFGNKKYPQSIAAFRKGIALTPWDMILYSNIAQCFTQTSQYDSVVAYCRLAVKQDANYGKAYMDMAAAFARAGVRDSAAKYEGLARQFNPGFRL
jgi:tetratricopeptide (TPR) repeat protein